MFSEFEIREIKRLFGDNRRTWQEVLIEAVNAGRGHDFAREEDFLAWVGTETERQNALIVKLQPHSMED